MKRNIKYGDLTPKQRKALDLAEIALKNAYNPYSEFSVGACLVAEDQFITGTNVENSAYGSTICAERAAILRANAMGLRHFSDIAIIAKGKDFETTEVTAPCGSCRQVLFEFSQLAEHDVEVILSTTQKDKIIITTVKELLPLGFGPNDLGIDIKKYR